MNAINAATDHTSVCSRLTGTPRSAARSALLALVDRHADTAHRRQHSRPTSVNGATIMAITSFVSKTTVPIVSSMSNGAEALSEEVEILTPKRGATGSPAHRGAERALSEATVIISRAIERTAG